MALLLLANHKIHYSVQETSGVNSIWSRLPAVGVELVVSAPRSRRRANEQNKDLLNGWKEIAAYLGRGVRTIQRWEQALELPVHRPRNGPRSACMAFKPELDRWLKRTQPPSLRAADEIGKRLQAIENLLQNADWDRYGAKRLEETLEVVNRLSDRLRLVLSELNKNMKFAS